MTKGLVKVSHSYSKVEFAKPGSLGNMTLPPRGESCNRTRHGGARRGWQAESNRKVLKTDVGEGLGRSQGEGAHVGPHLGDEE